MKKARWTRMMLNGGEDFIARYARTIKGESAFVFTKRFTSMTDCQRFIDEQNQLIKSCPTLSEYEDIYKTALTIIA